MGKSYPTPPNPYQTANAQTGYNTQAAISGARLNAVNQYGPSGSTTYQFGPNGAPISQTVQLSPDLQQYYDTTGGLRNTLAGTAANIAQYVPSGPFQMPDTYGPDSVASALYARQIGMAQPQLDQANNQSLVTLGERGIPIGSAVWNQERDRLAAAQANAYNQAAQNAVLGAGQEADRELQAQIAYRNAPIGQIAALLGAAPAPAMPQFNQLPDARVAPADYAGQVQNNYNEQIAATKATNDGLFSLGQTLLGIPHVSLTKTLP